MLVVARESVNWRLFQTIFAIKILFPKYLVHHHPQVVDFMVVYADEDHAVLAQQVPRQEEPRVHHVQPFGMVASARLGVGGELYAVAVYLPGVAQVVVYALAEVVGVDELVACICRVGLCRSS